MLLFPPELWPATSYIIGTSPILNVYIELLIGDMIYRVRKIYIFVCMGLSPGTDASHTSLPLLAVVQEESVIRRVFPVIPQITFLHCY